jgi:hypothetical protein
LDSNGLLPPKHNPASVPPADNPSATASADMAPAVAMPGQTCEAIRLFDATLQSERYYDLVNCLDGLTFGFGNWPQAELGAFFTALGKDSKAEAALVERFLEVFKTNPAAWAAFKQDAKLTASSAEAAVVQSGINALLKSSKLKNVRGLKNKQSDGTCASKPAHGKSFYFDHADWLVPALEYAFRDPAIVAFQVRYWEEDIMQPAAVNAKALGLPKDGVFLMAFYESNPGQVKSLQKAVKDQQPPKKLPAGERDWKWDGSDMPAALSGISLDQWHLLLVWQAMCPVKSDHFRIRNRNIAFFSGYLAKTFKLPEETKPTIANAKKPENCNPAKVTLRK